MTSWPGSNIWLKNAFAMWYLNENELIWEIWGHIDLKQPQNLKIDFKSAQVKSAASCLKTSVNFISGLSFWNRTYYESSQNFPTIAVLHIFLASL